MRIKGENEYEKKKENYETREWIWEEQRRQRWEERMRIGRENEEWEDKWAWENEKIIEDARIRR